MGIIHPQQVKCSLPAGTQVILQPVRQFIIAHMSSRIASIGIVSDCIVCSISANSSCLVPSFSSGFKNIEYYFWIACIGAQTFIQTYSYCVRANDMVILYIILMISMGILRIADAVKPCAFCKTIYSIDNNCIVQYPVIWILHFYSCNKWPEVSAGFSGNVYKIAYYVELCWAVVILWINSNIRTIAEAFQIIVSYFNIVGRTCDLYGICSAHSSTTAQGE